MCYQYWPADDTKGVQKYGKFSVSVLQATKQDGFIQRIISINNPKVMEWVGKINFVAYIKQLHILRTNVHQSMSLQNISGCPKLIIPISPPFLIFVELEFSVIEVCDDQW